MASMLTTVDNPYDPRLEFKAWYAWDVEHGYNTCDYLARVAVAPDELPQSIIDYYNDKAMDEIINIHDGGLYKKLPAEDAALAAS